MNDRQVVVVLITAATVEEAERIAAELLRRRACACINLIPNIRSLFRWQGEIQTEDEVLMVAKTTSDAIVRVREIVTAIHSYDVPEVIALPVVGGSEDYLDWVRTEVTL